MARFGTKRRIKTIYGDALSMIKIVRVITHKIIFIGIIISVVLLILNNEE